MRNELRLKNSVPRVFSLKTLTASGDLPRGEFNIVWKGRIFIMTLGRGCIPPMSGAAGAFSPLLSNSLSPHSPVAGQGIFIWKGLGTTGTKLWAALHRAGDSHCSGILGKKLSGYAVSLQSKGKKWTQNAQNFLNCLKILFHVNLSPRFADLDSGPKQLLPV